MREFPPVADLQFLVGKEIGQIALDPWSLQFRFSDEGRIAVQWTIDYVDLNGLVHRHQEDGPQDTSPVYFREIIMHRISALEVEPLSLTLTFDNGAKLQIYSYVGPYECGQIHRTDSYADLIVF